MPPKSKKIEPKIGDVIVTRGPHKYSLKELPWWIFKCGCYKYQRDMFPKTTDRNSLWTTHVTIYTGNNKWLSVTTPRALLQDLDVSSIDLTTYQKPFALMRYAHIDSFTTEAFTAFKDMVNKIVGTEYDYAQIVGMALHNLFPNLVSEHSSLVTGNKNKVVCSVGALACLIAGWKATDRIKERPGGDPEQGGCWLEAAPPALFLNHNTFNTIFKFKW